MERRENGLIVMVIIETHSYAFASGPEKLGIKVPTTHGQKLILKISLTAYAKLNAQTEILKMKLTKHSRRG